MLSVPARTPWLVKKLFPSYIWNKGKEEKCIYLSFDDGPTPEITEWVLNTLREYNAQATFFCIGKNVELYPEIYKKILDEGHKTGNHTQNHLKGWKTSTSDYLENIAEASSYISSNLFRPPYGRITSSQAKALQKQGYSIIMWDVLAKDWDRSISQEKCAENVLKNAREGSIIVFHDSIKAEKNMKYALRATLDHFSKKGYCFKALG
ncbi:polysaccharide deacetylase family protein [Leptobacterium flavescens]|uniref:Polysaccharide deacetylase family protein n=1 Tax=Leptobacterium flavescens TaxID=472055 RepID=A0A6P0UJG2_9FLAO|nr:polysaccharide deacetylase family protein [Leptobacterium flavescens]NER12692.1 polysaccharide deacetylase family protein [Leptobacterium flavescens]